jgi:molybdate transport system substrate-binding protein
MATRQVLADLARAFETRAGTAVQFESVGGVDAAQRVAAGEAFDLVVLAADAIDRLIDAGHLQAGSRVDWLHSGVALAVKAGANAPDISSEEAVRQAVLAAASIGFSTGPSGVALLKLFQTWGIVEALGERLVQARPGVPVASLVASGEVALGFQQLSELLGVEGIQIVGPLPEAIHIVTTFCAALPQGLAADPAKSLAVRALLDFMRSPEVGAMTSRHGMAPA